MQYLDTNFNSNKSNPFVKNSSNSLKSLNQYIKIQNNSNKKAKSSYKPHEVKRDIFKTETKLISNFLFSNDMNVDEKYYLYNKKK